MAQAKVTGALLEQAPASVEVAQETAAPTVILRSGTPVITPTVNAAKVDSYLVNFNSVDRSQVPRVLRQSIPANTRVPLGTRVDFTLASPADINTGLFDGMNADIAASGKMVSDYLPLATDPTIQAILNKGTNPEAISAADQATFNAQYSKLTGFQVVDGDPTRDFAATFNSVQGLRAFE